MKFIPLLAFSLYLMIQTTGCSESESNISPTFNSLYTKFFQSSCIQCHAPGESAYVDHNVLINMSSLSAAYNSLVNQNVNGDTSIGTCGSVKLVSPGQPSNSYLVGVLHPQYRINNFAGVSNCNMSQAEHHGITLNESQKAALIEWVSNGALNN